jgi:hypothetical protein
VTEPLLALTRVQVEGVLVVVMAFVLFVGGLYVLIAAVFGLRMGYLIAATGFFAFMIILSAIWAFGWPSTPRFLGPKGELPHWEPLAAGFTLASSSLPQLEQYPAGPWKDPKRAGLTAEVEPATLAVQEFLAEEAATELREAGVEGEITAETFEVRDVRFITVEDRPVAVGRAAATTGGPQVLVAAIKNPGNEGLPSYVFLGVSIIGFAAHLPFLDRAERRRKEILTGGDQAPWRGPA